MLLRNDRDTIQYVYTIQYKQYFKNIVVSKPNKMGVNAKYRYP